jgi:hypothetical protein
LPGALTTRGITRKLKAASDAPTIVGDSAVWANGASFKSADVLKWTNGEDDDARVLKAFLDGGGAGRCARPRRRTPNWPSSKSTRRGSRLVNR